MLLGRFELDAFFFFSSRPMNSIGSNKVAVISTGVEDENEVDRIINEFRVSKLLQGKLYCETHRKITFFLLSIVTTQYQYMNHCDVRNINLLMLLVCILLKSFYLLAVVRRINVIVAYITLCSLSSLPPPFLFQIISAFSEIALYFNIVL